MNKTAIKNFAIEARKKLIKDITYQMRLLGIDADGIKQKLPQSAGNTEFYDIGTREPYQVTGEAVRQRRALVRRIEQKAQEEDYTDAFNNVIEEVAYTWFNRLIAIRFMEVNDYLPGGLRVLSAESANKVEPELVTTPFDGDLEFTDEERVQIAEWQEYNKTDELFKMLFIKECNALNEYLPELFEKTKDYTELLLNISVTDPDGVVSHLVKDIPEEDFNVEMGGQVEIIGWLYQYYNTKPKAKVFGRPSGTKIKKEEIPAATQLFTPDWIVRYMVENSLGRMWVEGHRGESADKEMAEKFQWKYYLPEAEQEADVETQLQKIREEYSQLNIEEIKFLDPCMGSGHILVYAFDVFMQIYQSLGYDEREAAELILSNNLYGLDIDDRAFQLSYFALFMKARQYNRRILKKHIELNICAIQESNDLKKWTDDYQDTYLDQFKLDEEYIKLVDKLINQFYNAKEYGSIIKTLPADYEILSNYIASFNEEKNLNLIQSTWIQEISKMIPVLVKQAKILSSKFDVCVTNPPYMGHGGMNNHLINKIDDEYEYCKNDLFSVFIFRNLSFLKPNGLSAIITQQVWMHKTVYAQCREHLLSKQLINMVHLGTNAFSDISGEIVNTAAFVLHNRYVNDYKTTFCRLLSYSSEDSKRIAFLNEKNRFYKDQKMFKKVKEYIYDSYFVDDKIFNILSNSQNINDIAYARKGLTTGNNDRFVRLWFEVSSKKLFLGNSDNIRWFPMTKGGDYRRWYGNNEYVVNWENNGYEIRNFKDEKGKLRSRPQNIQFYFREGISWNDTGSKYLAFRYQNQDYIPNASGPCVYENNIPLFYLMGVLNSTLSDTFMKVIAPSLKFEVGQIARYPIIYNQSFDSQIKKLVHSCVTLSKEDWDELEISWGFKRHALIKKGKLRDTFEEYQEKCLSRFKKIKQYEKKLNEIFIKIYGLDHIIDSNVLNDKITIKLVDCDMINDSDDIVYLWTTRDVIVSLISYAVGCMFGRYSLDEDGLTYYGGNWDFSQYVTYTPDEDNIIPIFDEEYTDDDIVSIFAKWVAKAFGQEYLEDNLTFIAESLGGKGTGSRDRIRQYFLKDFFKDHFKTYKKHPIYWLYDSGKNNGFKALVYMHRYDEDTTGRVRVDYLHRIERTYESEILRMTEEIEHGDNAREIAKATKRREKLQKQLKECQEYDEQIAQPAIARIGIDLDDGVKVNYEKVQTVNGKIYKMLAKI